VVRNRTPVQVPSASTTSHEQNMVEKYNQATLQSSFDTMSRVCQSVAVRLVLTGTIVALVGPAGCGKSVVLRSLVDAGRQRFGADAVLVLAWAGSAAHPVVGVTVASVLRTTVGNSSKETILRQMLGDPVAHNELHAVRRVVIDEAPTIQGRSLDRLEFVLRRLSRKPGLECSPFGGRSVLVKWCLLHFCVLVSCLDLFFYVTVWVSDKSLPRILSFLSMLWSGLCAQPRGTGCSSQLLG